jgi:uncharacterized protein (TIGR02217 family)
VASFDDVHLPEEIESGALVGPRFSTSVISMQGGKEQRNSEWDQERLTANIAYGLMRKVDEAEIANSFQLIMNFYRARRGRWRGFRFKDWSDYEFNQNVLVPMDDTGLRFQVGKWYDEYFRAITRPVPGTLFVSIGGDPPSSEGNGWTLDPLGVIKLADRPFADVVIETGEFDVPMRFDTDVMQVNLEWAEAGSISSIDLIQIREYTPSIIGDPPIEVVVA